MSTIGNRLKEERERLKLSQTSFGELGGVQKQAQLKYEKGDRSPDADYLAAIATASADVLYILTGLRADNTASTPNEMAYLRACRKMPSEAARAAGREVLVGILASHGISMAEEPVKEDQAREVNLNSLNETHNMLRSYEISIGGINNGIHSSAVHDKDRGSDK